MHFSARTTPARSSSAGPGFAFVGHRRVALLVGDVGGGGVQRLHDARDDVVVVGFGACQALLVSDIVGRGVIEHGADSVLGGGVRLGEELAQVVEIDLVMTVDRTVPLVVRTAPTVNSSSTA